MTSRTTRFRVDSTTLTVLTNTKRVWDDILYSSKWGALPGSTGMARLALSEEDKCVRDFFVQEATAIGADVSIDEMGNIFAVLPGARKDLPPIGMGSHLDTQPAGESLIHSCWIIG
jgi:beta-ureidopropionase / N-carbamoyl-L-amino-acid hydrolase